MRKTAQRITLIKDITLAIADCKYRAPLPPRLYDRFLLYYKFFHFSRYFLFIFCRIVMIFVSRVTGLLWTSPPTGNGRCQMFFVVGVCTARTVSDVFCCWRFCRHRPLHNIFCDIVGDDAHIVPFCFVAEKQKKTANTVFFHHHTDNSASSPRTSLYLSKTGET